MQVVWGAMGMVVHASRGHYTVESSSSGPSRSSSRCRRRPPLIRRLPADSDQALNTVHSPITGTPSHRHPLQMHQRDESTLELDGDIQLGRSVLRPTHLEVLFLALELRIRVRLRDLAKPRLFLLCRRSNTVSIPPERECNTGLLSVNL